ncbi:MAG: transglutaminase-like domain-containing protein [Hydrogenobacter thermophilus]|uniref:transglutaminase domain-containing protein n=1 Tax=Hydrogenobacter thermophilus TaxID=940 RepID=UPI001C78C0F4|nr:transglutaminase-like domain-containing protein [Hydrogenobacter thermophilus]QWK20129.1 MAG: transglutaminase-like domain-containing protein [Hydrogenobacter thermophilus]
MDRREFLSYTFWGACGLISLPSIIYGRNTYRTKFSYAVNLPFGEAVRLWVPVPENTSYQKLLHMEVKTNASYYELTADRVYNAPILYAEFKGGNENKSLEVIFDVEYTDRSVDVSKLPKNNGNIPDEAAFYLKPTDHIPTDGIVKEYADRITSGKKSQLEKVKAIYDWVVENTFRDPQVQGCGVGDVKSMLETGYFGGKCTDINSLFVALCRASGIPAREIFGIRVRASSLSKGISSVTKDATKAQHCRAEFYLGQWVPADPADVRKLILEERLPVDHPKVKQVREFLFGNWDAHWVAFNSARDFSLEPPLTSGEKVNEFMYPLAEVNGKLIDKYKLTFELSKYTILA